MTIKKRIVVLTALLLALLTSVTVALGLMLARAENFEKDSKANVFTVNIGELKLGEVIPEKYYKNTVTGTCETGVLISQKNASVDFSYDNAINITNYTKNDPIIEFYALNGQEGVSMIDNLTVTITDAYDSANSVSVYAYTDYSNLVVYTRVRYNGLDRAVGETTIRDGSYGIYYRNTGFNYGFKPSSTSPYTIWSESYKVHPFSVAIDYDEMAVYVISQNGGSPITSRIIDLDNPAHVGAGSEWKGFTDGMAKVSVSAQFLSDTMPGGVIIKSVAGSNIDGEFTADATSFPSPEITLDKTSISYFSEVESKTYLPNGTVGKEFRLPSPAGFDWYYGVCDNVNLSVYKVDGSAVSTGVDGLLFTPTEAGEYYVEYVASNEKNSSSKRVYFNIDQEQIPISIVTVGDYNTDALMSTVTVPETEFFGGSGKITKTEKLYYNGEEIAINPERTVYLNKVGTLTLEVACTPYSGDVAKKCFTLIIEDDTVLNVAGVPRAVYAGKTVTLPDAHAYNSKTGEKATVKIFVDGQELSSDRTFEAPTDKKSFNVKYLAITDLGEKEKSFNVTVLPTVGQTPASFFLSDGSVDFTDSKDGLIISTSTEGAQADFAFPVITRYSSNKMYIVMSGIADKNNFEYLDIMLGDYDGKYNDIFIRVRKDPKNATQSIVSVSGTTEEYTISGTLTDPLSAMVLYISGNQLYYSYGSQYVCKLADYDAERSMVSFRFGGVTGEAGVTLTTLSNQAFVKKAGVPWRDQIAPVIAFPSNFEKYFNGNLGGLVELPKVTAYDVLQPTATVKITVLAPDGSTVLSTESANSIAENSFILERIGDYQIKYSVSDGKANSTITYKCTVVDNVTPTLEISGKIAELIPVGTTIKLPSATAKDNVDGSLKVYVQVRNLTDYTMVNTTAGQSVTFSKAGRYEITYYAFDGGYNYVRHVFSVSVGE